MQKKLSVGDVLAQKYKLVSGLGQGAMGQVFEAEDLRNGLRVAVKVVLASGEGEHRERFDREVKMLSRLQHPNLLLIRDFGEFEGHLFLVTERLVGKTLEPGLSLRVLKKVFLQIGDALEEAHSAGLVHRDVKPGNLFLEDSGRAVLLDFGLARAEDANTLTKTGALVGSLGYMPPEAFHGVPTSSTGDWYAWGITIFELIEGKLPFTRDEILNWSRGRFPKTVPFTKIDPTHPLAQVVLATVCNPPKSRPDWPKLRKVLTGQEELSSLENPSSVSDSDFNLAEASLAVPRIQVVSQVSTRPKRKFLGVGLGLVYLSLFGLGVGYFYRTQKAESPPPATAPVSPVSSDFAAASPGRSDKLRALVKLGAKIEARTAHWKSLTGRERNLARSKYLQDPTSALKWTRYLEALKGWLLEVLDGDLKPVEVSQRLEVNDNFFTYGITIPRNFAKEISHYNSTLFKQKLFTYDDSAFVELRNENLDFVFIKRSIKDLESRLDEYLDSLPENVRNSGIYAVHFFKIRTPFSDERRAEVYDALMITGLSEVPYWKKPEIILDACAMNLTFYSAMMITSCERRSKDKLRILGYLESENPRLSRSDISKIAQKIEYVRKDDTCDPPNPPGALSFKERVRKLR